MKPPPASAKLTVESYGPADARRHEALRLILSGEPRPSAAADGRVEEFRRFLDHHGLRADPLFAAHLGERLLTAVAAVASPGRTALVMLAPARLWRAHPDGVTAVQRCLRELILLAGARGLVLLQALLLPGERELGRVLADAGFEFLAELIYLDCQVDRVRCLSPPDANLALVSYTPRRHALFVQALEESYAASLDCPKLAGVRRTEDVLAGHRATGVHDPDLWYVGLRDSKPVGVLLLSGLPAGAGLELVYMGVSKAQRGHGVGERLMAEAINSCRRRSLPALRLAVDGTNQPARRLYERWGFVETERRLAWIAQCGAPAAPSATVRKV